MNANREVRVIESILEKEFNNIKLSDLSNKECLLLSYLSMLRVGKIIKFYCKHEEFAGLSFIDDFYYEVEKRLFYDYEIPNNKIDDYLDRCEEIIPIIENYNNNYTSIKESALINQLYSIVEELFYFISIQSKEFELIDKEACKSFIFLPANIIDTFIKDMYASEEETNNIDINIESIKLIEEIDRIKNDKKMIKEDHMSIKNIMNKYINLDLI